jgi:hypothetical protein
MLVFGVGDDEAPAGCVRACGALGSLVELGLGSLGLVGLEEGARGYCPGAAFELAESADAAAKEFKGLMELVAGDLI